jgi:transcriptional regulator with XRE-family HTH domain
MTFFDGATLGKRIAKYRRENGWSMDELAERTGLQIKRDVIANIENGRKKDLSVNQLILLAAALEVSPAAILVDIMKPGDRSSVQVMSTEGQLEALTNWQSLQWIAGTVGWLGTSVASRTTNDVLLRLEAMTSTQDHYYRLSSLVQDSLRRRASDPTAWSDDDERLLAFQTEQAESQRAQLEKMIGDLVDRGVDLGGFFS